MLVYRKRIGELGLALRLEYRLKLRTKHQKEAIVRVATDTREAAGTASRVNSVACPDRRL